MISRRAGGDLTPEQPVDVGRVTEDHRQQHDRSDEEEALAARVGGRVPDRHRGRHDHGEQADAESDIGQQEQAETAQERHHLLAPVEGIAQAPAEKADKERDGGDEGHRRPGQPAIAEGGAEEWHGNGHDGDGEEGRHAEALREAIGPDLELALGLPDQPARSEQPVADDQGEPGE